MKRHEYLSAPREASKDPFFTTSVLRLVQKVAYESLVDYQPA
jgi:hypothetical protein